MDVGAVIDRPKYFKSFISQKRYRVRARKIIGQPCAHYPSVLPTRAGQGKEDYRPTRCVLAVRLAGGQ